jgi:[protein-PII] uridylyltransferase
VDGTGGPPDPAVLLTTLRRIQEKDPGVLERISRRDAAWRPGRVSPDTAPRVLPLRGASTEATVVQVRAADRPGLLHRLGRALADLGVDVRSAHVETYAGQAVDVLYLCGPGGGPLPAALEGPVVAALVTAADVP